MFALVGCDESAPPPAVPASPPAATQPAQEDVTTAPRKPVLLDVLPFTLDVPTSWKVVRHGDRPTTAVAMLEGPLPSGSQAYIILSAREGLLAPTVEAMIKRIEKDRPAIEKAGGHLLFRDLGEARVIERRQLLAGPSGRLPSTAPSTTLPSDATIDWRIQLFVPLGTRHMQQYELNLMDLRADTFAQDEAFLTSILSTLKYADAPPL